MKLNDMSDQREYLDCDVLLNESKFVGFEASGDTLKLKFVSGANQFCLEIGYAYDYTVFTVSKSSTVEGVYTEKIDESNVLDIVKEFRVSSNNSALLGNAQKLGELILASGWVLLVVEPIEGATVLAICDRHSIVFRNSNE